MYIVYMGRGVTIFLSILFEKVSIIWTNMNKSGKNGQTWTNMDKNRERVENIKPFYSNVFSFCHSRLTY